MSVQIANPLVVAKIDRLARVTGLGKTAAVEAAVDRMLGAIAADSGADPWAGVDAIVAQMHLVPLRADGFDGVEYDEAGLPK